jgi:hypothetical protein
VRLPFLARNRPTSEPTEETLWRDLDKRIAPFKGYREALATLKASAPRGYALVFSFHYVDADILNGGISQLNANPTWSLLLEAVDAANVAGCADVDRVLRQALLYYHERGRSRFKKSITDEFFAGLDRPMSKSLRQLDEDYYALEEERRSVVSNLLRKPDLWRP